MMLASGKNYGKLLVQGEAECSEGGGVWWRGHISILYS